MHNLLKIGPPKFSGWTISARTSSSLAYLGGLSLDKPKWSSTARLGALPILLKRLCAVFAASLRFDEFL